jgi:hypothetical protein
MGFNYRRTPYDDGIPWSMLSDETKHRIREKADKSWKFKIGRCCMTCQHRAEIIGKYCKCELADRRAWTKAKCLCWTLATDKKRLVSYERMVDTKNLSKFFVNVDWFYAPSERENAILHVGKICANCNHFKNKECLLTGSPRKKPWSFGACRRFKLSTNRSLTSQWAKIFKDMGIETIGNQWQQPPTRQKMDENLEKIVNESHNEYLKERLKERVPITAETMEEEVSRRMALWKEYHYGFRAFIRRKYRGRIWNKADDDKFFEEMETTIRKEIVKDEEYWEEVRKTIENETDN